MNALGTFVEGSSREDLPSVGEAGPPGADAPVLRGAGLGTLLTVHPPGRAHGAAAHVHPVSARQRLATLILVPLQVALLATRIWRRWVTWGMEMYLYKVFTTSQSTFTYTASFIHIHIHTETDATIHGAIHTLLDIILPLIDLLLQLYLFLSPNGTVTSSL